MRDGDLQLRELRAGEEPALGELLAQAEVARWWVDGSFRADSGWAIDLAGELSGWLEFHEEQYE